MFTTNNPTTDIYWQKIIDQTVDKQNITELFLCRVSAFTSLARPERSKIAKNFLLQTMSISEIDYKFAEKTAFVGSVLKFGAPQISAQRSDNQLHAVLYKIPYTTTAGENILHEISFFTANPQGELTYTHKFNLTELAANNKFITNTESLTRQLGDDVLHAPARSVVDFSTDPDSDLQTQIRLMKNALLETGGVGIAANQCADIANPLNIFLAGIDYNNPKHVLMASTRYPNALFLPLKICINPTNIQTSKETAPFPEGCLSFRGILRAQVSRPRDISFSYQNVRGEVIHESFTGVDARVIQHEIDHILNGYVFIQRILDELNTEQIRQLTAAVKEILDANHEPPISHALQTPEILFTRDDAGGVIFDIEIVKLALIKTNPKALVGLYDELQNKLSKESRYSTHFVK